MIPLCASASKTLLACPRVASEKLGHGDWYVLVPAWLVASFVFWLWTPRFLLHRKVPLGKLVPGALMSTLVLGGAIATMPLFLPPSLNEYGGWFGSFGVVIVMIGCTSIMITMSLVCAVFSPVWVNFRASEKKRKAAPVAAAH